MEDYTTYMHKSIISALNSGKTRFIIYPFGLQGEDFKQILNKDYGIKEVAVIDKNVKCRNVNLISMEELNSEKYQDCDIFVVSEHMEIWFELRKNLLKFVHLDRIIDVFFENGIGTIKKVVDNERVKVLFNPVLHPYKYNMKSVGKNTGNLVYAESMKENYTFDVEDWLSWKWIHLGKKNVFAIIPASNFVAPYATWIEGLIPIIEKSEMNITFAGLGAQGNLDDCPQDIVNALSDRQIYFFKLISERAKSIGVRGEFTAACLERMGINNVEIIGCPSFFQYQNTYPVLKYAASKKILFTADRSKEKIYSLIENENAKLIKQEYLDGDEESPIFFNYSEWNQYIQEQGFTFAFGSRFHGNMMALRNQVPTLWITHDWRTLELARYLKLPYLDYYGKEFKTINCVEKLIEHCDYNDLYREYPKLLKRYQDFIELNMES